MADSSLTASLRDRYLSHSRKKIVVGISWKGGGRQDRIKQKSITTKVFAKLISGFNDIQFVSLQYGDVTDDQHNQLQALGASVFIDHEINALKDMDRWLAQVDACDAVLSVANTTIHGSGGLGKPTICLLSQDPIGDGLKHLRKP